MATTMPSAGRAQSADNIPTGRMAVEIKDGVYPAS